MSVLARSRELGLSACIVAMDEEDRIGDCLDSVAFCDEIVVVDSHSKDGTRELAASKGAKVIERDWPGHVAQKEFAVRATAHDWVLCVDADERIPPDLREEISALRVSGFPGHAAWRMRRLSSYLGRWMEHGAWVPDWQLRLFDGRRGKWGGHDPHDKVETEGPVGSLHARLHHHPYRNLSDHLRTIDRYTTTMAEGMHHRGIRAHPSDLVLHPLVHFLRGYVLKLGLLEGWRGYLQACLGAHYARMKYAKLLVAQRNAEDLAAP